MDDSQTIKVGDFVIVQRQGYTKLHKMKQRSTVTLGKDAIELDDAIGANYCQTFRMLLKEGTKRNYTIEAARLTVKNDLSIEESGYDNRNIVDDGCSQTLSKDEIEAMRDQALSSGDILEKLVANSKTFASKTEYAQEKYMRKKEKKYFEYIQLWKPTVRLLAQLYFRLDPAKTQGMRLDDLSQVLSYANVHSEGTFLVYDSGTSGLLVAALMNRIGSDTTGKLIHAHPGNECQKNAFAAMQFPYEQAERCIHVNIYSVLRCFYQEKDAYISNLRLDSTVNLEEGPTDAKKRKLTDIAEPKAKRPCWQVDNERACRLLNEKVDALIVVAKEHPQNIVKELVQFLKAGRTLVVFNIVKEPLQELYFYLKSLNDFINVKLSNNFVRFYQVLPERTHPEVTSNFGGYILHAYKIG